MTENNAELETSSIETLAALEAILFVASQPVPYSQLSNVLDLKPSEIRELCQKLQQAYDERNCGIRLQFNNERVQLTTAPGTAPLVEAFLGIESAQKLSRASIEALTIIAYRQPISRPGIDQVRGVNSDSVVQSLLRRGLVEELGRAETPGRPVLYGTTQEFLLYFGLSSIDELPPFEEETIEFDPRNELRVLKQ